MNKDWCASGREIVYKHIADVPKRMPGNGHGYYGYKRRNWLPTSLAVLFSTRARSRPPWRRVALAAVPSAAVRCGTARWPEESLRVWAAVESPFRGELAHPPRRRAHWDFNRVRALDWPTAAKHNTIDYPTRMNDVNRHFGKRKKEKNETRKQHKKSNQVLKYWKFSTVTVVYPSYR